MAAPKEQESTRLLQAWRAGDKDALERLSERVYGRLSRLARSYLQHERNGHTLETGALVNEVFIRLVDQNRIQWRDRTHFFAIATTMMRRILVDHARRTGRSKRGGDVQTICLHELHDIGTHRDPDLVRMDDALVDLEEEDPALANLVVLRYFGGLTRKDVAEVLAVSPTTVSRQWRNARAWLFAYLADGGADAH